jgi:hypothetical protein
LTRQPVTTAAADDAGFTGFMTVHAVALIAHDELASVI